MQVEVAPSLIKMFIHIDWYSLLSRVSRTHCLMLMVLGEAVLPAVLRPADLQVTPQASVSAHQAVPSVPIAQGQAALRVLRASQSES